MRRINYSRDMSNYLKSLKVNKDGANIQGSGRISKSTENANYVELSRKLHEYGLETVWVRNDWYGADLIAYHPDPVVGTCIWIQLKSRVTIMKKYINKGELCIAFRHSYTHKETGEDMTDWYLIPHDKLVEIVPESWKTSTSWIQHNYYHAASPSHEMISKLSDYKL